MCPIQKTILCTLKNCQTLCYCLQFDLCQKFMRKLCCLHNNHHHMNRHPCSSSFKIKSCNQQSISFNQDPWPWWTLFAIASYNCIILASSFYHPSYHLEWTLAFEQAVVSFPVTVVVDMNTSPPSNRTPFVLWMDTPVAAVVLVIGVAMGGEERKLTIIITHLFFFVMAIVFGLPYVENMMKSH